MARAIFKSSLLIVLLMMIIDSAWAETKLREVKVRHNRKFDFSQLTNNYTWTKREDSSREWVLEEDPQVDSWIQTSVERKMTVKGYSNVKHEEASFGIDYQIVIEDEGADSTHVRRGGGRANPYSYANVEGMPGIKNWRSGMFILNIVNLETGYVIWVGYADAVVVDKKNRQELIDQAVSEMLDKFPPH